MPTATQDTVDTLEQRVRALSPEQLARFHEWYQEYRSDLWDRQIEEDAKAGRLDHLIERARKNHEAGNYTEL